MLTIFLQNCTSGPNLKIRATVECVPGDSLKWELNKNRNIIEPDSIDGKLRILRSDFPTYYGFIDDFKSQDGDFLDCFIFSDDKISRQDTSAWNLLGLIKVLDDGEEDCKLVLSNRHVSDDEILDIIKFLTTYSDDEVRVHSFLRINDIDKAINEVKLFGELNYAASQIYIGHAYGSPRVLDRKMDDVVYKVQSRNWHSEFWLLGDYVQRYNDSLEVSNLYSFYKSNSVHMVQGNHDSHSTDLNRIAENNEIFSYDYGYIVALNTNFSSSEEASAIADFFNSTIDTLRPNCTVNVLSHQLLWAKEFSIFTNSKKHYNFGYEFFDGIIENARLKSIKDSIQFNFIAGDIGALNQIPNAVYNSDGIISFYAVGLGERVDSMEVGLSVSVAGEVNFINLNDGNELPRKNFEWTFIDRCYSYWLRLKYFIIRIAGYDI